MWDYSSVFGAPTLPWLCKGNISFPNLPKPLSPRFFLHSFYLLLLTRNTNGFTLCPFVCSILTQQKIQRERKISRISRARRSGQQPGVTILKPGTSCETGCSAACVRSASVGHSVQTRQRKACRLAGLFVKSSLHWTKSEAETISCFCVGRRLTHWCATMLSRFNDVLWRKLQWLEQMRP